ncbi:Ig-like domain-containing protein [Streptomyces sp. WI04-05B]|uniref:L,D-transpeptidase n=1 Tax=Streptomyces TaxID=1883 RepID=UPI0029AF634B|nr:MULTISPECIES: Ig-like domain-containing protein [unclassified Streptomyces]MDX2546489.1 Ig-like domain-containing protein [Streptomyces sp. WI04-05B]MDX2586150.1 Ig-like domain-containing protein [Streptomyces sp. WI04-05A]MDX3748801.1 Ig-like domain-containing protein [Streptomyces sp. AK08-02]
MLSKRRTGLLATTGAIGGVLAVTALGGVSDAAADDGNKAGNVPASQAEAQQAGAQVASDARMDITPGQGAYGVGANDPVGVTVSRGKLTQVTMTAIATGAEIPGTLSADGTSWKPNGRLERATRYQIAAEAEDAAGRSATDSATITTVSPANDFIGHLSPEDGSTVGVGMPVRVDFDRAISDRAAVRSEIQVSSSSGQQVVGHWLNDHRLDFRPEHYWKPGSTVTVTLDRQGVRRTVTFTIGRSQISTVDARTKRLTVVRDGRTIRTVPISSGGPEHPTHNGRMVISEKFGHTHMNGASVGLTEKNGKPSYDIRAVPHAMRLTDSGTFVHGNYWAADSVFGKANTSHGCVGLKDVRGGGDGRQPAAWFFDHSMIGDVVIVKNSEDKTVLAPDNGLSDWNMPWSEWVTGESTGLDQG